MANKRKVIPGVHLLFRKFNEKNGKSEYLLHQRTNTHFFDNHFSVPGGHIDDYESPIDCVVREGKEELNVKINPKDVVMANVIYRVKKSDDEVRIDFCFFINKWEGTLKSGEPHKHSKPKWYSINKFPKPIVPYVMQAIEDIEHGIVYTKTDV